MVIVEAWRVNWAILGLLAYLPLVVPVAHFLSVSPRNTQNAGSERADSPCACCMAKQQTQTAQGQFNVDAPAGCSCPFCATGNGACICFACAKFLNTPFRSTSHTEIVTGFADAAAYLFPLDPAPTRMLRPPRNA